MKRHLVSTLVCTIFVINIWSNYFEKSAITIRPTGTRFGDNIMNYIKAKFIAREWDLDFYFGLFTHADILMAYKLEKIFTKEIEEGYKEVMRINSDQEVGLVTKPTLFISRCHTRIAAHNNQEVDRNSVDSVMKNILNLYGETIANPEFGSEIKKMIQPRVSVKKLNLPQDKITVAVHVRKGSLNDGKLTSIQIYEGHEPHVKYENYLLTRHSNHEKFYIQD